MPSKPPDEVRHTPEPSPATVCRRKLKSIVVCTPNEQGMSNLQGRKLNYGKTIFPPPDSAENIVDILDCDVSPIECMSINVFFMLITMVPYFTPFFPFKREKVVT